MSARARPQRRGPAAARSAAVLGLATLACRPPPPSGAPTVEASASPGPSTSDAGRSPPRAAPAPAGTHADDAPWLELAPPLVAAFSDLDWTPDEDARSHAAMRDALCRDIDFEPRPCDGTGPWVLVVTGDGTWGHVLARHDRADGWILSAPFGVGGLARCAAWSQARLAPTSPGGRPAVVVEDHLEFPEYECVDEDVDEDVDERGEDECEQWMGSCGEPVTTRCTIHVDPVTLETVRVDGECDAHAAGEALGLSF